jgi:hypothetical protein
MTNTANKSIPCLFTETFDNKNYLLNSNFVFNGDSRSKWAHDVNSNSKILDVGMWNTFMWLRIGVIEVSFFNTVLNICLSKRTTDF